MASKKDNALIEIMTKLLKKWWQYEGAHKVCKHCHHQTDPGVAAKDLKHGPYCPVPVAIDMILEMRGPEALRGRNVDF